MFYCVIRGPFPVFLIRSFSSPQFSHCFIEGFQFPHCVIKGQRALNCPLRHQGPQFPHHVIKTMTSNFPSRYLGAPYHCVIKGPPFPPSRHQRDPNFQNSAYTPGLSNLRPTRQQCAAREVIYILIVLAELMK